MRCWLALQQPGLQSGVPVGSPYHNNIAAIAAGSADDQTTDNFSRISLEHLTSDRQKRFQRCIGTTSPASLSSLPRTAFLAVANGSWCFKICADVQIVTSLLIGSPSSAGREPQLPLAERYKIVILIDVTPTLSTESFASHLTISTAPLSMTRSNIRRRSLNLRYHYLPSPFPSTFTISGSGFRYTASFSLRP